MNRSKKLSKKEFDAIIKENLITSGVPEEYFGYRTDNDRIYNEYYAEAEFEKFVAEMKSNYPEHYKKYYGDDNAAENKGGMGGELISKRGRWGMMPPKMASVASSSRFCYLALRDGANALLDKMVSKDNVEFEKECRIFADGPTAPQLDAYIKDSVCDCYVEVKCHEIFDHHKIELKNKYWDVLQNDKALCRLLNTTTKNEDSFIISKTVFGLTEEQICFDVKQFLCHLLGIARQSQGKQSKLIYLFFKPTSADVETASRIDEVFEKLKREIDAIFQNDVITEFCKDNGITLEAVVQECDVMKRLDTDNSRKLFSCRSYKGK